MTSVHTLCLLHVRHPKGAFIDSSEVFIGRPGTFLTLSALVWLNGSQAFL